MKSKSGWWKGLLVSAVLCIVAVVLVHATLAGSSDELASASSTAVDEVLKAPVCLSTKGDTPLTDAGSKPESAIATVDPLEADPCVEPT